MATFLTRALGLKTLAPSLFDVDDDNRALVSRYHVIRKDEGVDVIYTDNMQYWPRALKKGLDIEPYPDRGCQD